MILPFKVLKLLPGGGHSSLATLNLSLLSHLSLDGHYAKIITQPRLGQATRFFGAAKHWPTRNRNLRPVVAAAAAGPSQIPLNNWSGGSGEHHSNQTKRHTSQTLQRTSVVLSDKNRHLDKPPHLATRIPDEQLLDQKEGRTATDPEITSPTATAASPSSYLAPQQHSEKDQSERRNSSATLDPTHPLYAAADGTIIEARNPTSRWEPAAIHQKDRVLSPLIASSYRLLTAIHKLSTMPSDSPLLAPPSPTSEFGDYLPRVTKDLDDVTTHAAALPGKSDLSFHRTLDRKLAKELDEASDRILKLTGDLLELLDTGKSGKKRRWLEDEEDVKHSYKRGVVEVVDALLEDAVSLSEWLLATQR